jgi:hypothetical protein
MSLKKSIRGGTVSEIIIASNLTSIGFFYPLSHRLLEKPVKNPVFPVNPRKLFQKLKFWNSLPSLPLFNAFALESGPGHRRLLFYRVNAVKLVEF